MQTLNLPIFEPTLKTQGQKKYIFDSIRKKFITFTPEEWVRQSWVNFLVNYKGVPAGLVGIEVPLSFNDMKKRADIVVYNRQAQPLMVVETKATSVKMTPAVCEQIANYNAVFQSKYLIVSNGLIHFLYEVDFTRHKIVELNELPDYSNW